MGTFSKSEFKRRGDILYGTVWIMRLGRPTVYHKTVRLSRSLSEAKAKARILQAAASKARRQTSVLSRIMPKMSAKTAATVKAASKVVRAAEKRDPRAISALMKLRSLSTSAQGSEAASRARALAQSMAIIARARSRARQIAQSTGSRRSSGAAKLVAASSSSKRGLVPALMGRRTVGALSQFVGCDGCL